MMMLRYAKQFVERYGLGSLFRLPIYPIVLLVTTPIQLTRTLWNCRILSKGRLQFYPHFNATFAMLSPFYWTAAINISRHGRSAIIKTIGLGNFSSANWFFYSKASLLFFWRAGALCLLTGMFGWLFAHLLWVPFVSINFFILVLLLIFFSTSFYVLTFGRQNYHVIGWMFAPIFLIGILTHNYWLMATAALLTSFGSTTAATFLIFTGFLMCLLELDSIMLLAHVPVILKLALHLRYSKNSTDSTHPFVKVMRLVGAIRSQTKYKRKSNYRLDLCNIHFLFSLLLMGSCVLSIEGLPKLQLLTLLAGGLLVLLGNNYICRLSDEQNVYIFTCSILIAVSMFAQNYFLLIPLWIGLSPLPIIFSIPIVPLKYFDVLPALKPFDIQPLLAAFETFFLDVKKDESVLLAFNNPNGSYEALFDGYRALLDIPAYVACQKEFLFIPYWWAITEANTPDSPEFWGRDLESVKSNVQKWKLDYVIVYQTDQKRLDNIWELNGFTSVSEIDWTELEKLAGTIVRWPQPSPKWWLLKVPTKAS